MHLLVFTRFMFDCFMEIIAESAFARVYQVHDDDDDGDGDDDIVLGNFNDFLTFFGKF